MKKIFNFILSIIAIIYLFKGIETELIKYRLEDNNLFIDKDFIKRLLNSYKQDIIYSLYEFIED